jgi:hypothetical protein
MLQSARERGPSPKDTSPKTAPAPTIFGSSRAERFTRATVRRIGQCTRLFSEMLAERHLDRLPALGESGIFHAHCHQKVVLDCDAARDVLAAMEVECHEPEPGCRGMAGSFGFEIGHAELSRKIGEMNLLPAVRRGRAVRRGVV